MDRVVIGNFPLQGGIEEIVTPRGISDKSKMLSLGFARSDDSVRDHRRVDFNKLSNEGKKREHFRQFLEDDRLAREKAKKDEKLRELVHPFEISPSKQFPLKVKETDPVTYDGMTIGNYRTTETEREDRKKAAEVYKSVLLADEKLGSSIKLFQESDESYTANRKPYQRRFAEGVDIDPNCALINIGNDNAAGFESKRKLNKQMMLDNIAVANSKQLQNNKSEVYEGFYIGSDPATTKSSKDAKKEYKEMLDNDISPTKSQIASRRITDPLVDFTGYYYK